MNTSHNAAVKQSPLNPSSPQEIAYGSRRATGLRPWQQKPTSFALLLHAASGFVAFMPMRRLDQLLSNLGYCSRREAQDWVANGRVTVGSVAAENAAQKVDPHHMQVDNEPLDHPDGLLLLLHKPLGLVCSHDPREGPGIYGLLPARWRARKPVLTSVGRLDKDTSGLLLLTDQTMLVHRLTSPKHKVPKVYRVTVDRDLDANLTPLFASGTLQLIGEKAPCAPARLHLRDARTAELTLTEGKYHQVRRMFASQGWNVTALHRERFGPLELGDLPAGQWRELNPDIFDS